MINACGLVTFNGAAVSRHVTERMAAAAPHLVGVDGVSSWEGIGAAFSHATSAGYHDGTKQPVVVDDVVCVADARIDNRAELRADLGLALTADGHMSDALLIALAYRRWGGECAARLLGDFAMVVWDTQRRCLFSARDAMGSRPLYYRAEPGRVLVATGAGQILAAPGVSREPDEAALIADIAGLYALPSMTPFRGIDQLAPGHALTADADGYRVRRYWDIDPDQRIRHRHAADYAEDLRELLAAAVRDRIGDSKTVGMFLSGGLDATSVASTAAEILRTDRGSTDDLRAYSWAFDDLSDDDERRVSRIVSDAHGIAVTDVHGDDAWPLHSLTAHAPHLDDPFIWLYQPLVDRTLTAARQEDISVMLTTDRGDEMVGNWVYDDLGLLLAGRLPSIWADLRAFTEPRHLRPRSYIRQRLARPLLETAWPPHVWPSLRRGVIDRGRVRVRRPPAWVPPNAARRVDLGDIMRSFAPTTTIRDHARRERYASVFHPDSLRIARLRQRTFARHGLTYADPWGDRRIAAFVCAIPQWRVQRHARPKLLTQEAMRGVVPEAARRSPSRASPVGLFRRAFNERETTTVHRLLDDSRAASAGWLDAEALRASFDSYLRGEDQQHDFWHPLCVEMWLRRWWD